MSPTLVCIFFEVLEVGKEKQQRKRKQLRNFKFLRVNAICYWQLISKLLIIMAIKLKGSS